MELVSRQSRSWAPSGLAAPPLPLLRAKQNLQRPILVSEQIRLREHSKQRLVIARATENSQTNFTKRLRQVPALGLAACGATLGTLLDLFHGRAGVLTYNVERGGILWEGLRDAPVIGDAPVSFVILQTSVWVPLLLSAFYVVDGGLYLTFCRREDEEVTKVEEVVIRLGALGLMLMVSAILYENYVPYSRMRLVLLVLGLFNWVSFDKRLKTPLLTDKINAFKALALSAFVGIAAPVLETFIIGRFELWSYPRPDFFVGAEGFPSWVPFCYFFYHPFLFSLSSYLQDRKNGRQDDDDDGGGTKAPVTSTSGTL